MKFCWATLRVKNMEESLAFYQDIVGLKITRRFSHAPGNEIAFLGEGETQVELICDEQKPDTDMGQDISLGFMVDSVDEMMEDLKKRGIGIHSGPFQPNPHVKFFYLQDPNGLKIQFVEKLLFRRYIK